MFKGFPLFFCLAYLIILLFISLFLVTEHFVKPMVCHSRSSPVYSKCANTAFNPLRPEFTIAIFIHYKPRIAVAIPDL